MHRLAPDMDLSLIRVKSSLRTTPVATKVSRASKRVSIFVSLPAVDVVERG